MPRDYVPASDAQFHLWLSNFKDKLAVHGPNMDFSGDELTTLSDAVTLWEQKFAARLSSRDSAKASTAHKRQARRDVMVLIRPYARRVHAHPTTDDAIRAEMGLSQIDQPTPGPSFGTPDDTPLLALDFGTRGQITIHFGPNPGNENRNPLPDRAIGAVVQVRTVSAGSAGAGGEENGEETSEWQWLDNPSASPYVHVVQPQAARVYAYRVAYLYRRGRKGPWSDPAEAAVTP